MSAVTWTDREGLKADETQYFIGQNPGPDAWRTLAMAGLHVFTDARIDQYPDSGINFQHLTHFGILKQNYSQVQRIRWIASMPLDRLR